MDVFRVHERLIVDYRDLTSGVVWVCGTRLAQLLQRQKDAGGQWPDPWLSLNPAFASRAKRSNA